MMNALNQSMAGNIGGMGMLGNPALANMQMSGLGAGPMAGMSGMRMGVDPTAGAASFLVQQAMASQVPMSAVGAALAPERSVIRRVHRRGTPTGRQSGRRRIQKGRHEKEVADCDRDEEVPHVPR
jgi:hypothetical protein